MNPTGMRVESFSIGAESWLPAIDHIQPDVVAYNYFETGGFTSTTKCDVSPPLPYARSQTSPTVDPNEASLAWVTANWESLVDQYPDRWIVVQGGRVVVNSTTPEELQEQIARLNIQYPFITRVGRSRTLVGKMAYDVR